MRTIRATAYRSLIVAFLLVLAGALIAPASAAPSKLESTPEEGEELHEAPERVSITFDQPLDAGSTIEVTNHCGERVDEQPTEVEGNEMSVALTGDSSGTYHVTYLAKSVAGVTGEQKGAFTFSVHMGPGCDGKGGHHHGGGQGSNGEHNGGHEGTGHEGSGHEGSGHEGTGHEGSGHEGAAHRGTTHSSSHTSHSSMTMGSGHTDHSGHDMSDGGSRHAGHGGKHSGHTDEQEAGTPGITNASGNAPLRGPGRDAAITALTLCALVGSLGGFVLRFSATN